MRTYAGDSIDGAVVGAHRAPPVPAQPGPAPTIRAPHSPQKLQLSTGRWCLCRGCSLFTPRLFTFFLLTNIRCYFHLEGPRGHTSFLRAPQICHLLGSAELVTATGPLPGLCGTIPSQGAERPRTIPIVPMAIVPHHPGPGLGCGWHGAQRG